MVGLNAALPKALGIYALFFFGGVGGMFFHYLLLITILYFIGVI